MPTSGPTVLRRQLGRRLRRLREAAGKIEQEVEDAKLISRTKLWRIESGKVAVRIPDVRALCWFYGVDADHTDALATMAVGTGEQGWWEDYGDVVPGWFQLYVELEGVASQIRCYDGELIPGLLQTESYARAIYHAARPGDSEKAIARHVAVRMERQDNLVKRDPPPQLTVVLGAGALTRQVGGPAIMAVQIDRLRQLDKLDQVEIKVLTWESGAHPAMLGAFNILDCPDPEDPDVVYLETQVGSRYLEKPAELAEYRKTFEIIYRQAVPIKEYP